MKEDVRKLDKIVEATKTKQQLALDEKIKSRQKQWEAEKCEKRQREVLQNSAVIPTKVCIFLIPRYRKHIFLLHVSLAAYGNTE